MEYCFKVLKLKYKLDYSSFKVLQYKNELMKYRFIKLPIWILIHNSKYVKYQNIDVKKVENLSGKIDGANVYCLWHYNMCNTGGQTIMEEHIATEKINEYM